MTVRVLLLTLLACGLSSVGATAGTLRGVIHDQDTGKPVAARLYIESLTDGRWYFAKTADAAGSALIYDKARDAKSVEKHTTLSAHPFEVELPSGRYRLTVERGKEYLTATRDIDVGSEPVEVTLSIQRWIHMAARGWYSGDTHVHRPIAELSNVALAEDLHAIYPMSQWVTVSHTVPEKGRVDPQPIPAAPVFADEIHAIVPFNTEYEIFSVGPKRHTLGAVLILGQKEPLKIGIPPLKAVADEARRQGALLDLEKHSWAWTPIIAPVMRADLYPLSNNHIWRTEFAFKSWTIENNWRDNPRIETDAEGFTESGWLHYGWEQYYAMLNCGLRMRPTAGTASGVHPVPAGFSRVYVDLGAEKFTPELWQRRLNEGRSFVTTGPMLMWSVERDGDRPARLRYEIHSQHPLRVEVLRNGDVFLSTPQETAREPGAVTRGGIEIPREESAWYAVRCFETLPGGRSRFAHSAPVFIDIPGRPLRPRRDQVRYLIQRCEEELARNRDVLSEPELAEYREALTFYQQQLPAAR